MKKETLFLPLDLPPLPDKSKIATTFFSNSNEEYVWWNMDIIFGERNLNFPMGSRSLSWTTSAQNSYPALIEYISSYLPFREFVYIHLAHAIKPVRPHVDENYVEAPFANHMTVTSEFRDHLACLEPVGYRFLVQGGRNSFYLCDRYDPTYKSNPIVRKSYCALPEETDFFLIHNSRHPHGVDLSKQDTFRLTGFVLGWLNPDQHSHLIKQSWKKYGDYAKTKESLEYDGP